MKDIFLYLIILNIFINIIILMIFSSWAYANMLPTEDAYYISFIFQIFLIFVWLFIPTKQNKLNIKNENLLKKSSQKTLFNKTDINNANIEELKTLPFINTALAKRIIKKREEINGFKSVEDVCLYLKFNINKSIKFREYICVNPRKIPLSEIKNDERSIDL